MATYVEFIWAQLRTAHTKSHPLTRHLQQPLWGEILPTDLTAVKPAHAPQAARTRCVVTAYVGSLFSWIFGEGVEIIEPDSTDGLVSDDEFLDEQDLGVVLGTKVAQSPKYYDFHHGELQRAMVPRFTTSTTGKVKVGDVVEMRRDDETKWKRSTQKWYAYVTDRWDTPKGVGKLKILWLYWPEDVALCMNMKYPYSNEVLDTPGIFSNGKLFFSDHCECGSLMLVEEVVRKVAVEFFCLDGKPKDPSISLQSDPLTVDAEFFVRQKYFSVEHDIHVTTLIPRDLSPETPCPCNPVVDLPSFRPGEFVLVRERKRLQPYRFEMYEGKRAWVRKMLRRREVQGQGKVNELVWTEAVVDVAVRRVVRKCRVVKVKLGEEVPRLAEWGGSSDWFFYHEEVKLKELSPADGDIIPKTEAIVEERMTRSGSQFMEVDDGVGSSTAPTVPDSSLPPASIPRANPENQILAGTTSPAVDVTPSMDERVTTKFFEQTPVPAIKDQADNDLVSSVLEAIPDERKLRGLDLFCGGGNFGRGVGDGGAVQHKWCVLTNVL